MQVDSLLHKILIIILVFLVAVITKNGNIFDNMKMNNSNVVTNTSSNEESSENVSEKSAFIALILALVVPIPGIQSFYAGRVGKGIAQLLTFNFLFIGWIYDVIMICMGKFKDSEGKVMRF